MLDKLKQKIKKAVPSVDMEVNLIEGHYRVIVGTPNEEDFINLCWLISGLNIQKPELISSNKIYFKLRKPK